MEQTNYYQLLHKFSLFNTYFAFLDTESYLADGLFINHRVRVYFGNEFVKPDSPYRIIFCHVRRWDKERFCAAMSELPKKMLLCGNVDYLSVCADTWKRILQAKHEGRISDEADGAAEQAQ